MSIFISNTLPGLFKRIKLLIVVCSLSVIICIIVSLSVFQYYESTAKIVVSTAKGLDKAVVLDREDKMSDRNLRTIAAAVKSRHIMGGVVKELNLENVFGQASPVSILQKMTRVSPVRGTDIIDITVSSGKPELATQIANTITRLVISDFSKKQFSFERDMEEWFLEQASDIRKQVEEAAMQLRHFNESASVPDVKLEYDLVLSQIKNLQVNLAGVKAEAKQAELAYGGIKNQLDAGTDPEELLQVQNDDSYRMLKSEYLVVKDQIKMLLGKYLPNHPEIANRKEKLEAAERMMSARAQAIINDALNDMRVFNLKAEELKELLKEKEDTLRGLEEERHQYTVLLNNLKEKELLYNALVDKMNKELVSGLAIWRIDLLQQAYLPDKKSTPPLWVIVLLGIIIGFFIILIYNMFIGRKNVHGKNRDSLIEKKSKGMYIERIKENS